MDNNAQLKVVPIQASDDAALNIFPTESPEKNRGRSKLASMALIGGATVGVAAAIGAAFWLNAHASAALAATATGSLRIVSEPSAATVTIDSIDRGSTPLTVAGLSVGQHDVVVRSGGKIQRRTLQVDANTTTSLVMSGVESGTPSGWLSATTSAPLRIFESGRLVGSTESDRIMLPAGEHTFEFSSDALGFSATRTVSIGAGQTSSVALPMPQVTVSLNAAPWAQVWVDGQALGATPIGDFKTTIGPHEVIFRHPQLGERRLTALLTLKEPARVAIDMTKR